MPDSSRIFICYKKRGADGRESNAAYQLFQFLSEVPNYSVWMDEGLDAGILWEKTIYENLIASHVVILAVGNGTSQSEWVRRELSIAMAFGIQIIPVGLNIDEQRLSDEIGKLGLSGIHYRRPFNMTSQTARAIVGDLAPAIARAHANTHAAGYELINKIHAATRPKVQPAKPALSAASRRFAIVGRDLGLHIATGDVFRLSGFEFLVNSENDYMQMARIFDMASLSSNIRHFGSSTEHGFLEDTIQLEIERTMTGRPRPLPPGSAIATSSGGPSSSLYRNNRISHIIHVTAVQAVIAEHRIAPVKGERQIRDCVAAALSAIQGVCRDKGVISPPGTSQRLHQERMAEMFSPRRAMLPMFGTGRGGLSPREVGPVVLESVIDFFAGPSYEPEAMPLTDIHVSVFSEEDAATMQKVLLKMDDRP